MYIFLNSLKRFRERCAAYRFKLKIFEELSNIDNAWNLNSKYLKKNPIENFYPRAKITDKLFKIQCEGFETVLL